MMKKKFPSLKMTMIDMWMSRYDWLIYESRRQGHYEEDLDNEEVSEFEDDE